MPKLTLTTDDGEVLGIWAVTTREGKSRSYCLNKPLSRNALIQEIAEETEAHEQK